MADSPNITLEQWRALLAVVDAGGYAQAAAALHKSQSSITYAVQKLEALLGVKAFEVKGRKAELTATGTLLYRRARALIEEASELERAARKLSAGWEAEIRLAVEIVFPNVLLLMGLAQFGRESPTTRIEVFETVIDGTSEALLERRVDLAIAPRVPAGFMGESLTRMRFVPAAHPDHPLHRLKRPLTLRDLRKHRHLVVRDTAQRRTSKSGFLDAEQRWTFSNVSTSIQAAARGYGFAWYPEEKIRDELMAGTLKPLPMRDGAERWIDMYLVFSEPELAGPGTKRLAEILRETTRSECAKAVASS